MTTVLTIIVLAAVFLVMTAFTRRSKGRSAAADQARRAQLAPGSQVMTTSGLYGTVVAINPDDSVLLSIAAGVEVKWTIAALRVVDELPETYRAPIVAPGGVIAPSGERDADSR